MVWRSILSDHLRIEFRTGSPLARILRYCGWYVRTTLRLQTQFGAIGI
jgi:hypothetical protein